jgi:hypothetical protein
MAKRIYKSKPLASRERGIAKVVAHFEWNRALTVPKRTGRIGLYKI